MILIRSADTFKCEMLLRSIRIYLFDLYGKMRGSLRRPPAFVGKGSEDVRSEGV